MLLAEQTCSALRRRKAELVARLAVCWCAVREFFEEKVEPVLAEPMEIVPISRRISPRWPRRPTPIVTVEEDLARGRCRPRGPLYL